MSRLNVLSRLERAPLTIWLAVVALVLSIRYPIKFARETPFLMDFEVYRAAAVRLWQGQGLQLYLPTTNEMMVFKYAPAWAILWLPLAWIPPHAAAVLWTALTVLWVIFTLAIGTRICRRIGFDAPAWLAIFPVLLILRPLGEEMGNGQVNALWALLVVGALAAMLDKKPWLSAAEFAAAILLKLPAIVFVPYVALRGDWRQALRIAGVTAVAACAGSALVAPSQPLAPLAQWAAALGTSGRTYAFEIGNQSFLALLGRFLTDDGYGLNIARLQTPALVWINLLGAAGLFAWIARPGLRAVDLSTRPAIDSALLMILMTIFSPSCWLATYTVLLFPLQLALAGLWTSWRGRRLDPAAAGLALLTGLLVWFTHKKAWRLIGLPLWHGEAYVFLVFMILPWLGLALTALLLRQRASAGGRSR